MRRAAEDGARRGRPHLWWNWLWAGVALWCVALPCPARAIPPFARVYDLSCTTCHVGGPQKLTPFGEAFRDSGYHIPGELADSAREPPLALGNPARAAIPGAWRQQVWPGEIPGQLPLGVVATLGAQLTAPQGTLAAQPTLEMTAQAELVLGASLGRHLSVFGGVEVSQAGVEIEQLFGVAQSLFERWLGESALNVKVGAMRLDLFAVMPGRQRSALLPLPLSLGVGRDGFSVGQAMPALELYGLLWGRVKWVLGGGNGAKPIDDVKTRRDFFARLQVKVGGPRLDYKNAQALDTDPTLSLGLFGYAGVGVAVPTLPEQRFANEVYRAGFDARFRAGGLDVLGQVVLGHDGNPDGLGDAVRHASWSLGVDYPIFPWLQPLLRYEEAYFDSVRHPTRRRLVMGLQAFVRTNVRLLFEGASGLTDTEPHVVIGNILLAM